MPNPIPSSTNGLTKILGKLGTFIQAIINNAKWIFLTLVLVLALINISTCNQKNSWQTKYKTYYAQSQAVLKQTGDSLATTRKALVQVDSLKKSANHQRQQINRLNTALVTIGKNSQALVDSLNKMTTAQGALNPQVCMLCQATVRNLTLQVAVSNQQITNLLKLDTINVATIAKLEGIVHSDTVSIISLRRQIIDMPRPEVQHLFWTLKLTPNQSFLVGVLATLVTVVATHGKL